MPPVSWGNPLVLSGLIMVLIMFAAVVAGVRRRQVSLAVPPAWFLCGMAILVYGAVTNRYTLAFDHYLYLPSIGLVWLGMQGMRAVSARIIRPGRARPVAGAVFLLAVAAASLAVIHQRNRIWSGNLALWSDAARKSPLSQIAHFNLAYTLWEADKPEAAIEEYRRTIETDPGYFAAIYNMGYIYEQLGKLDLAEESYRRVLRLNPGNPRALLGLGSLLLNQGNHREAASLFERALRKDGRNPAAWNYLGLARLMEGKPDLAAAHFRRALDLDPGFRQAAVNLGRVGKNPGDGGASR